MDIIREPVQDRIDKMNKEQSFFIQILSDHLNGKETKCNDDLDWTIIHQYALKHQVSGIVYVQAKDCIPTAILDTFRKETLATVYCASSRNNDVSIIRKDLEEKDIPSFVIKGPAVAALFPESKLRAMGDVDLVVKHEDREKCHNILLTRGYQCISRREDREWQYYRNNMELELHDRLVYKEAVNEKGQDVFFNNCWRFVHEGELDWNFHLLFLIFHLRKHFMNAGVGFRMFMDLAVVAQNAKIDWTWVKIQLDEIGMYSFAQKCYGFIEKWFGIRTPLAGEIDNIFFEEATQKIFADGVFGFHNKDNEDNDILNEIRHSRFAAFGMIRVATKQLFPSHKKLKNNIQYSYLNECSLLLPAAWIHRAIRLLMKGKTSIAIKDAQRSFVSADRIEKRNEMLKKWGI